MEIVLPSAKVDVPGLGLRLIVPAAVLSKTMSPLKVKPEETLLAKYQVPVLVLVKVVVEPAANVVPPLLTGLLVLLPVLVKLLVVPLKVEPINKIEGYVAVTLPEKVAGVEPFFAKVKVVPSAVTTPELNVPVVRVSDPPVIVTGPETEVA